MRYRVQERIRQEKVFRAKRRTKRIAKKTQYQKMSSKKTQETKSC